MDAALFLGDRALLRHVLIAPLAARPIATMATASPLALFAFGTRLLTLRQRLGVLLWRLTLRLPLRARLWRLALRLRLLRSLLRLLTLLPLRMLPLLLVALLAIAPLL